MRTRISSSSLSAWPERQQNVADITAARIDTDLRHTGPLRIETTDGGSSVVTLTLATDCDDYPPTGCCDDGNFRDQSLPAQYCYITKYIGNSSRYLELLIILNYTSIINKFNTPCAFIG